MPEPISPSAQKVQEALKALGVSYEVREMPASTRTAKEAAAAIGCTVAQIAKSIVFRVIDDARPLLVIASGTNRVNEKRIGEVLGRPIEIADADYVREMTGFAIGGVPPVGHRSPLETLIDSDLLKHDVIWAAAGTPRAVFPLTPNDLQRITNGKVVDIL